MTKPTPEDFEAAAKVMEVLVAIWSSERSEMEALATELARIREGIEAKRDAEVERLTAWYCTEHQGQLQENVAEPCLQCEHEREIAGMLDLVERLKGERDEGDAYNTKLNETNVDLERQLQNRAEEIQIRARWCDEKDARLIKAGHIRTALEERLALAEKLADEVEAFLRHRSSVYSMARALDAFLASRSGEGKVEDGPGPWCVTCTHSRRWHKQIGNGTRESPYHWGACGNACHCQHFVFGNPLAPVKRRPLDGRSFGKDEPVEASIPIGPYQVDHTAALAEALRKAAEKFREYERIHASKMPCPEWTPHGWAAPSADSDCVYCARKSREHCAEFANGIQDKAARNREMAEMCEAALCAYECATDKEKKEEK